MNLENLSNNVSKDAYKNIEKWLNGDKYSDYHQEIKDLIESENWPELEDAFFKDIEFGTGGRRGKTGAGSNRINKVTVGESAQALAVYAKKFNPELAKKGMVIACDTRLTSEELSKRCASVAAANGFKVYIFESYRSTPELSFAVRYLDAGVGVVITASHNPPTDNGFKAYWSDGAQLVAPHDQGVLDEAAKITEIKSVDFDEAVEDGKIEIIGEDVDKHYHETVLSNGIDNGSDLKVVYSPLHGAGQRNSLPVLKQAGFNVVPVEEQLVPDGNFPTIPTGKPNPEEAPANKMAVDLMLKENADIAITNDPDADRIGVIVNQDGKEILLSGNQSAVLASEYVLKSMKDKDEIGDDDYIAKTIVTTDLLNAIAAKYEVKSHDNLLVGFKFIGELIRNHEGKNGRFIIGGEESYGLLKGDYARDKDGAIGALILAQYAAELKKEGKTLYDRLFDIYEEYGLYVEDLVNVQFPGADGFRKMQEIMDSLRNNPPKEIGGQKISKFLDYKTLIEKDLESGESSEIDCLHKGNVLVFELGQRSKRVTIRPSGTEPKIKLYIEWFEEFDKKDSRAQFEKVKQDIANFAKEMEKELVK